MVSKCVNDVAGVSQAWSPALLPSQPLTRISRIMTSTPVLFWFPPFTSIMSCSAFSCRLNDVRFASLSTRQVKGSPQGLEFIFMV